MHGSSVAAGPGMYRATHSESSQVRSSASLGLAPLRSKDSLKSETIRISSARATPVHCTAGQEPRRWQSSSWEKCRTE